MPRLGPQSVNRAATAATSPGGQRPNYKCGAIAKAASMRSSAVTSGALPRTGHGLDDAGHDRVDLVLVGAGSGLPVRALVTTTGTGMGASRTVIGVWGAFTRAGA
jgi:hypothetical protein